MTVGEWVGVIGGALGAISFGLTEKRRRRDGRLTKRQAARELTALEARHKDELAAHDEAAKKEQETIRDEHTSRGMLSSSFFKKAQEDAARAASRERDDLIRRYEVERDRLKDIIEN